jgi:FtsP/CotA-like multicopper oxidase with cupredoxin domain
MMKKRYFQKFAPLAAFVLLATHSLTAQTFVNPIPIPPLLTGDTFNISAATAVHNFNPNKPGDSVNTPIATYAFNQTGSNAMTYLGPTMVWKKGSPLQINVTNNLYVRTTSHWHGLNLPSPMDGGPHEPIASGETWRPAFTVIDPVQTVWYHSHLMDSTTLQVNYGLAGMIIVEDPADNLRAQLPHDYGQNDFPIVIQEKGFVFVNHVATAIDTAGGGSIHTPGNGPFTIINGVLNGVLSVPPQMVRFRILNGSLRKSFQLGISPTLKNPTSASFDSLWLVATDGGYTAMPYHMDSILISPGERMEMVTDFSAYSHGDTVYLSNLVRSIPTDIVTGGNNGQAPPQPQKNTPGNAFLAFVIDTNIHPADPISSIPSSLVTYTVDTSNIFMYRTKNLMGSSGSGSPWTIDGDTMNMELINDTILVNTKEMWTIHNASNISHPFHIHKVQFQVVQFIDSLGNSFVYPNLPDFLKGYKDDVLVRSKCTIRFIAQFDSFPDNMIAPMNGFMYHCHILTHEDNNMMHQFVVVDSATYYNMPMGIASVKPIGQFTLYPNPAGDQLNLKGTSSEPGKLRIVDLLGRTVREEEIRPFDGTTSINVQDLPRGFMIVEWTSEGKRFTQKILLQ